MTHTRVQRSFVAAGFCILAVAARNAAAQVIAPFADPGLTSCTITAPPNVPTPLYIVALAAPFEGFIEARFRITGLPLDLYATTIVPNAAASIAGDPFGAGVNFYFTSCQGPAPVVLYTITLTNVGDTSGNRTILVERHTMPTNPLFQCPLLVACDPPEYTVACVTGGQAFLNGASECDVALDEVTWSHVKALYD